MNGTLVDIKAFLVSGVVWYGFKTVRALADSGSVGVDAPAQGFKTTNNWGISTGPLALPFAHLLTALIHSLSSLWESN